MYCSNCGQKLPEGAKFCPNCGIEINKHEKRQNNYQSKEDEDIKKVSNNNKICHQQEEIEVNASEKEKGKDVSKLEKKAIASLVLGIIGMVAWAIPIIGLPIQIIGMILGKKGLKSSKYNKAKAGLIMCGIGLILSLLNAIVGAYQSSPSLFEGAFYEGLIGLILGGLVGLIYMIKNIIKKKWRQGRGSPKNLL